MSRGTRKRRSAGRAERFRFECGRCGRPAALFCCALSRFGVGVAFNEAGLVDVGDVELRFGGDEEQVAGVGFFFVSQIDCAGGFAGFEGFFELG